MDKSFQTTKNLERALRAIRGHEAVRANLKLWIDAICIDQKNNPERKSDCYTCAKDLWHSTRCNNLAW